MDLNDYRQEIDRVDRQMVDLIVERMQISKGIGEYKKSQGLPVYDPQREALVFDKVGNLAGEEMADFVKEVYQTLIKVSKDYQNSL